MYTSRKANIYVNYTLFIVNDNSSVNSVAFLTVEAQAEAQAEEKTSLRAPRQKFSLHVSRPTKEDRRGFIRFPVPRARLRGVGGAAPH